MNLRFANFLFASFETFAVIAFESSGLAIETSNLQLTANADFGINQTSRFLSRRSFAIILARFSGVRSMGALAILVFMYLKSGFHLVEAMLELLLPLAIFATLALIYKRKKVIADLRAAKDELKINAYCHLINVMLLAPFVVLTVVTIRRFLGQYGIGLVSTEFWNSINSGLLLAFTILLGDFIGYARHRIEHTAAFWPIHAIHHSDTHLSWISFARIHPLNQITTAAFDLTLLFILGLPAWAISGAFLFRHYYGMLVHADLPWTFGPLGHVFVSPAMHHWHHVKEGEALGKNFSIVFAFIDKLFGTFYLPGPCDVETGVDEDLGEGIGGQLAHPFKVYRGWLAKYEMPAADGPESPDPEPAEENEHRKAG